MSAVHAYKYPDKRVLLFALRVDHLGDLSSLAKIASSLVQRAIFPPQNIVLSSNDPDGYEKLNSKHRFKVVRLPGLDRPESYVQATEKFALQILFPDRSLLGLAMNQVPTLLLHEYNFAAQKLDPRFIPWVEAYSLGLPTREDPGPIGLCIDRDLRPPETDEERIRIAEKLSPEVKERIFQGLPPAEFFRGHRLYIGHAREAESWNAFLQKFCHAYPDQLKTVVIPSPSLQARIDPSFASVENLRLVFGPIDQQEMALLWKISQKESLATGDQSASEAIAADKDFVYEARGHKQKFAEALKEHYEGADPSTASRDICARYDCMDRLIPILDGLLEKPQKPCLELWRDPDAPLDSIPKETPAIVSTEQICKLQISPDGTSALYPRSRFDLFPLGTEFYSLIRKKIS